MNRYSGFRMLIVDDNVNNLFTLRSLISQYMDCEVIEADSGQKAIDIATREHKVDLIILDVQMPEMDGFQVASMLKIRTRTKDIPVIFLTAAFKADEFRRKGYEIGAADYLLKPIEDDILINKISTYFRLIEKERQLNLMLEKRIQERTSELEQTTRYLKGILDNMGEALLVLDSGGRITSANPATCKMLDYTQEQLSGLTIGDVFEERDAEQANAFMGTWLEAVIRATDMKDIDARFIASDGRRVPIRFSKTVMQDQDGKINAIICIAMDMTGFQRLESGELELPTG